MTNRFMIFVSRLGRARLSARSPLDSEEIIQRISKHLSTKRPFIQLEDSAWYGTVERDHAVA